jgi:hypothetical protein
MYKNTHVYDNTQLSEPQLTRLKFFIAMMCIHYLRTGGNKDVWLNKLRRTTGMKIKKRDERRSHTDAFYACTLLTATFGGGHISSSDLRWMATSRTCHVSSTCPFQFYLTFWAVFSLQQIMTMNAYILRSGVAQYSICLQTGRPRFDPSRSKGFFL